MALNNKPTRLTGSDHVWSSYTVSIPPGTSIEDALDGNYWSHVANKFRPYDEIEIIAEDGGYLATLKVLVATASFVKVVEKWRWEREGEEVEIEEAPRAGYVKWRGPHAKHSVLRKADNEVLREGFADKESAETWMRDYEKMVR